MNIWLINKDGRYQTVESQKRPPDGICKIGDAMNEFSPAYEYETRAWVHVLTGINISQDGTDVTLEMISANGANFIVPLKDCSRVFFFNSLIAWYVKTSYVKNNEASQLTLP